MSKKGIVTGALILTAANIITRILGFVYRIYMSNLIGAEGMGLFQLISPIYMLAWSLSASGLQTTVSKLVAQENAKRQYGNMGRILKQSVVLSASIGCILAVFIFFFADWIGFQILKDERTILSLRVLSLAIPFMAAGSCMRGYFYGLQETTKPAIAQVLEQIARMVVIYFLAGIFIPLGLGYACAAAVIGSLVGEVLSFLYVYFTYRYFKRKVGFMQKPVIGVLAAFHSILAMAIPLTANRAVSTLLQSIENVLIPRQLQTFGMTVSEAMSAYGQLFGMAIPLIFFPSAFITSLSVALVPAVSEAHAVNNNKRIQYTVSKSLHFTALIGVGTLCLFLAFPHELGKVIYNQDGVGDMLYALAWLCPFLYLQHTLTGILNGLGQQTAAFKHNLLGSLINIACIYFYIPKYGLQAFLWGLLASIIVSAGLNLHKTLQCTSIQFDLGNWFLKPGLAAAGTGLTILYLARHYIFPLLGPIWGIIFATTSLVGIYLMFLFLLQCITIDDIRRLRKSV